MASIKSPNAKKHPACESEMKSAMDVERIDEQLPQQLRDMEMGNRGRWQVATKAKRHSLAKDLDN
jgi:hypothetical protein